MGYAYFILQKSLVLLHAFCRLITLLGKHDMKTEPTKYDKFLQHAKNSPLIVALIIATAVVTAMGAWFATGKSLWQMISPPSRTTSDPRVFMFKDQTIRFTGGNGLSMDKAIVIGGALTTDAGIAAERYWIKKFYPLRKVTLQSIQSSNEKPPKMYDCFRLRTKRGNEIDLFFDVTSFFGTPGSECLEEDMIDALQTAMKQKSRKTNMANGELVFEVPAQEFKKGGKIKVILKEDTGK